MDLFALATVPAGPDEAGGPPPTKFYRRRDNVSSSLTLVRPETGADLLVLLDAGEDCWFVEPQDVDDEDNYDLIVSFAESFAHGASAVLDVVAEALTAARPTGAGSIYREDREFILIEAAKAGTQSGSALRRRRGLLTPVFARTLYRSRPSERCT